MKKRLHTFASSTLDGKIINANLTWQANMNQNIDYWESD